jgi:hypothetical protein
MAFDDWTTQSKLAQTGSGSGTLPDYRSANAMTNAQKVTMWLSQARGGTDSGFSQGENAAGHNAYLGNKIFQSVPYGVSPNQQQSWDLAGQLKYSPKVDYHNPKSYSEEDQASGIMAPTAIHNQGMGRIFKGWNQTPRTTIAQANGINIPPKAITQTSALNTPPPIAQTQNSVISSGSGVWSPHNQDSLLNGSKQTGMSNWITRNGITQDNKGNFAFRNNDPIYGNRTWLNGPSGRKINFATKKGNTWTMNDGSGYMTVS